MRRDAAQHAAGPPPTALAAEGNPKDGPIVALVLDRIRREPPNVAPRSDHQRGPL